MAYAVLYAFIAGLLAGILVNSVYRSLRIQKIKAEFERDLQLIEMKQSRTVAPVTWSKDVMDAVKDQQSDRETGT
jgi:hypothetical protein